MFSRHASEDALGCAYLPALALYLKPVQAVSQGLELVSVRLQGNYPRVAEIDLIKFNAILQPELWIPMSHSTFIRVFTYNIPHFRLF
jgi:hypothetical protein